MLPQKIADFINTPGLAIQIGSRNAQLQPYVMRGFAFFTQNQGETASVVTCNAHAGELIDNCKNNGQIAVIACNATNYETYQFKGIYKGHELTSEAEMSIVNNSFAEFVKILVQFFGPESAEAIGKLNIHPLVTITFKVEDVFNQTPGPGAGKKIN